MLVMKWLHQIVVASMKCLVQNSLLSILQFTGSKRKKEEGKEIKDIEVKLRKI